MSSRETPVGVGGTVTAGPRSDTHAAGTGERPATDLLGSDLDREIEEGAAFDAAVDEIRTRLGSNLCFLSPRLEDQIRRKLRVPPLTARSAGLAGLTAICTRLGLALLATAITGEWAEIPWARWMPIVLFLALTDVLTGIQHPAPDVPRRRFARHTMDDWTALLSTIERTADVQQLAEYTRRWYRLPVSASFGVAFAASVLLVSALLSPSSFGELPAGSIVLLTLLLYDAGETTIYAGSLFDVPFVSRHAKFEHELFWPSPVDSPEVRRAMRLLAIAPYWFGFQITAYLVLMVVLVSWSSAVVVPLAVSLGVVGYFVTIFSTLRHRASIGTIVERARNRQLLRLQHEINVFRSSYTRLSPEESEQLRGLIDLHNTIRDAPTTPTTSHALTRAAAGLIVPTIMFVITVFGEVSAERILDSILP